MDYKAWLDIGATIAVFLLAVAAFVSIMQTSRIQRKTRRKEKLMNIQNWTMLGFQFLQDTRDSTIISQNDARSLLKNMATLRASKYGIIKQSNEFGRSFRSLISQSTDGLEKYGLELERLEKIEDWGKVDWSKAGSNSVGELSSMCEQSFTKLLEETTKLIAE